MKRFKVHTIKCDVQLRTDSGRFVTVKAGTDVRYEREDRQHPQSGEVEHVVHRFFVVVRGEALTCVTVCEPCDLPRWY